jgi:hypothetical protein
MGSTSIFFLQADPLPQYLCRPPVNLAVNRLKSLLSLPALAFVTLAHCCMLAPNNKALRSLDADAEFDWETHRKQEGDAPAGNSTGAAAG